MDLATRIETEIAKWCDAPFKTKLYDHDAECEVVICGLNFVYRAFNFDALTGKSTPNDQTPEDFAKSLWNFLSTRKFSAI